MKAFFILLLFGFLNLSCTDSVKELKPDFAQDSAINGSGIAEQKVRKRLDYFDRYFFNGQKDLQLSLEQKTALYPVIKKKLAAVDKAKLSGLQPRKRRKELRDSIRQVWHPIIDALLTPAQSEARNERLKGAHSQLK